jgi:hypothetical protein
LKADGYPCQIGPGLLRATKQRPPQKQWANHLLPGGSGGLTGYRLRKSALYFLLRINRGWLIARKHLQNGQRQINSSMKALLQRLETTRNMLDLDKKHDTI